MDRRGDSTRQIRKLAEEERAKDRMTPVAEEKNSKHNQRKEPMHSIYLFMPYSYSIEPESLDALTMAPNGWEDMCKELGDLRLQVSRVKSSMLCESFNHGIATAKNGK